MPMQNHIVLLLNHIFNLYKIPVTRKTIAQSILTHPDYPSIQCISDALHEWKVQHVVFRISLDKLRILDIPVIAHLNRGEFVWVTGIDDTTVNYWSAGIGNRSIAHSDFKNKWSGAVLAVEDIANAGEPEYTKKHQKEIKEKVFKYIIAGIGILLIGFLTYFSWTNDTQLPILSKTLLILLNSVGSYISYILIKQEKHQSGRLVDKFCKLGEHIDCTQVISSRYSKLFGLISWAELGGAYFGSGLLWVFIAPLSTDWLYPLYLFVLFSLPFTLWSLIIQALMIRKWCLFCCSIVILLWINAAVLTAFYPFQSVETKSIPNLVSLGLLFLVCLFVVIEICKTNRAQELLYIQQRETARIKYDIKTVQAQLSEITHIMNTGFVWGNLYSSYDVTLYVSIICSHCGKAVKELRKLIETYPDFCFRLIFAVYSDNYGIEPNAIVSHLLNLNKTMDKNGFFHMLDAWYAMPDKSLKTLQQMFPTSSNQNNKGDMDALYQFSQHCKIDYTPAILINGKLLSSLYSYRDIYGVVRTLNIER